MTAWASDAAKFTNFNKRSGVGVKAAWSAPTPTPGSLPRLRRLRLRNPAAPAPEKNVVAPAPHPCFQANKTALKVFFDTGYKMASQ